MKKQPHNTTQISRRAFLTAAGVATAGCAVDGLALAEEGAPKSLGPHSASPVMKSASLAWDRVADMVICGSGAAAYTAAVIAAAAGNTVVIVEKASTAGGTTLKSGGAWWAPNNSLMKMDGYIDLKNDAMAYMARCSSPQMYDVISLTLGLSQQDYDLIEAYYDNCSVATDELIRVGALKATYFRDADGSLFLDYYAHQPENRAPVGRGLVTAGLDGQAIVTGAELINQLSSAADRLKVSIALEHRAERVVLSESGEVIGLQASHRESTVSFGARKAVIFATGGFTHNSAMADNFLRGPIFGGCAVPTNTGDFVAIATQAGAQLGNMNNAWWAEVVLEQALAFSSVPSDAFILTGDSMLVVNRHGHRIYDEKMVYNERTQVHFEWNPVTGEYPNLLTFMIYDQRLADNPGDWITYPIPTKGFTAPYVITGSSFKDLTAKISGRLKDLAGQMSLSGRVSRNVGLAPGFYASLMNAVRRFNSFAESGKDLEFNRGDTKIDRMLRAGGPQNHKPNSAMYPISPTGPYHCIILAAGTLDTKGGPVINPNGQILDTSSRPIPGLYGAGNCVASPSKQAYWAGGATIGAALAFGYLAAKHASFAPQRNI